MRSIHRSILGALAALCLTLAVAACGGGGGGETGGDTGAAGGGKLIQRDPANASKPLITVGSKNFTEQYILGELYAQTLEAQGFKVRKRLNLGSEQVAYKALRGGDIDAYPEYVGTSLTSFFKVKTAAVPKNPDQAFEQAKREYAKVGIVALPRTPFQNTYVLADLKETAQQQGNPKTISELMQRNPHLSLSGFPECRQRTDCLIGMRSVYGFKGKFISSPGKFDDLNNGQAQLSLVFGTDPQLQLGKYASFQDDKKLFPPYNISLGVRKQVYDQLGPKAIQTITRVQEGLTEEAMRELNRRADLEKQPPAKVAGDYLREEGFIK